VGFAAGLEVARRFITRLEPLREEGLQLHSEVGMGELIREDWRDTDGERRPRFVAGQPVEGLDQREVGVDRRFTEPVTAVGPAPVVQHPGEVTVQGEYEIHQDGLRNSPDNTWR
jgi:hypothetical protein